MDKQLKILIPIIIISIFLIPKFDIFADSSNETGVSLEITGTPSACNNNGTCDTALGEDSSNCPLDCPYTRPGGGGFVIFDTIAPEIGNLSISKITQSSAEVSWKTNELAFCQFFWGRTQEYEKEVIVENTLNIEHQVLFKNLSMGTKYHFKISCQDNSKNEAETKDQEFVTLFPPDISPPANISNFQAVASEGKIELRWDNPRDNDFKAVKIMRSEDFYPSDPSSGMPVYNNNGEYFADTGLADGKRYYYTAFTYDLAGNYSSGAIVSGVPNKPGITPPPEIITPASSTPEIEKLTLIDFDFIQEGEKIVPLEGKFSFKSGVPLIVSISYEKVPEILKTIMVTLKKDQETFSFLLRINKEKTRYEATILTPEPGIYPLILSVLNYKNQSFKKIEGSMAIEGPSVFNISVPWYKQIKFWPHILALIALALLIIFFICKKIKKAREPEKILYPNP